MIARKLSIAVLLVLITIVAFQSISNFLSSPTQAVITTVDEVLNENKIITGKYLWSTDISLYTINEGYGLVIKFDIDGNIEHKFKHELPYSYDLATDSLGNVYVLIATDIYKYSPTGELITNFGSAYIWQGRHIFIKGTTIYVSDNQRNQIFTFDLEGNYISTISSYGTTDGLVYHPGGMYVYDNGDILVADADNNRLQKFAANGNWIQTIGSAGSGDGQFNLPNALDVDSLGNIYVMDAGHDKIQVFNSSGVYQSKLDGYAAGSIGGAYSNLGDIVIGPDGHVYFKESASIRKVNLAGDDLNFFGVHSFSGTEVINIEKTWGFAIDAQGNTYVADYDSDLQKFDVDGNFDETWGEALNMWNPYDVAVDSQGNVYCSVSSGREIVKFDSSGNMLNRYTEVSPGISLYPGKIVVDSSDNVYFADFGTREVVKMDSEWNHLDTFVGQGSGNGQVTSIASLFVDHNGYIYVSDYTDKDIQKLDTDGTWLATYGGSGNGLGLFANPRGLFVDQNDNLYVSDSSYHKVQMRSTSGDWDYLDPINGGVFVSPVDFAETVDGDIKVLSYANANQYLIENKYQIDNLDTELKVFDSATDIEVTSTSSTGVNSSNALLNVESTDSELIFQAEVNMTSDRDWGSLNAETNILEKKAYSHDVISLDGVTGNYILYIPKDDIDNNVGICPDVADILSVGEDCTDLIVYDISASNVSVVEYLGQSYWEVSDLTSTGGYSFYVAPIIPEEEVEETQDDPVEDIISRNLFGWWSRYTVQENEIISEEYQEELIEDFVDSSDIDTEDEVVEESLEIEGEAEIEKSNTIIKYVYYLLGVIVIVLIVARKWFVK
jgi:sugar lactone lactonase YvrE